MPPKTDTPDKVDAELRAVVMVWPWRNTGKPPAPPPTVLTDSVGLS